MNRFSDFQKEITLILVLKLVAIVFIWSTWFSHPSKPEISQHLMATNPSEINQSIK